MSLEFNKRLFVDWLDQCHVIKNERDQKFILIFGKSTLSLGVVGA